MNPKQHPFVKAIDKALDIIEDKKIVMTTFELDNEGIGFKYYFNVNNHSVDLNVFKISEGTKEYNSFPFKFKLNCNCEVNKIYPQQDIFCKHKWAVLELLILQRIEAMKME